MNTILENPTEIKPRKTYFKGQIKLPAKPFTLKQVMTQFNLARDPAKKITKLGMYFYLQKMLKSGAVRIVGKAKSEKRGRKQTIYQVVNNQPVVFSDN